MVGTGEFLIPRVESIIHKERGLLDRVRCGALVGEFGMGNS